MIRFARRLQPGEYQMTRDDPIMTMETGFNSADLSLSIRYFATRPADRAEWSFGGTSGVASRGFLGAALLPLPWHSC
jgi:hypothetical protein